jgi:hypothetical protein
VKAARYIVIRHHLSRYTRDDANGVNIEHKSDRLIASCEYPFFSFQNSAYFNPGLGLTRSDDTDQLAGRAKNRASHGDIIGGSPRGSIKSP